MKHHCCNIECPFYLHNFATVDDIKNGTRKGLMNHLKYDIINNNYVPSFHLVAKIHYKLSYEMFLKKMDSYFSKDIRYKNLVDKEKKLFDTWRQLNDILII